MITVSGTPEQPWLHVRGVTCILTRTEAQNIIRLLGHATGRSSTGLERKAVEWSRAEASAQGMELAGLPNALVQAAKSEVAELLEELKDEARGYLPDGG